MIPEPIRDVLFGRRGSCTRTPVRTPVRAALISVFALLAATPASGAFAQAVLRDSVTPRPSAGSTIMWLDAGMAQTRQLQRDALWSAALGAGIQRATARSVFHLDAAALLGDNTTSAGQLLGAIAIAPLSSFEPLVTEITGSISRFRLSQDSSEGNRSLQLRQQLRLGNGVLTGGFSADAGISRSRRVDSEFARMLDYDATVHGVSGWLSRGNVSFSASWQRQRSNDFQLLYAAGFLLNRSASAYDLDHLSAIASFRRARWTVQGRVERQQGRSATTGTNGALSAAASFELLRGFTLNVGVGKQLADVLRGYPNASYSSVGVRYTRGLFNGGAPASTDLDKEAWLELPPVTGGILIVQVRAPEDAVVEIADSHSQWAPVLMERAGAAFVARIPLPSGNHRVAVRVNGGEWRAPRGLARVVDDLGGAAGLVVVP